MQKLNDDQGKEKRNEEGKSSNAEYFFRSSGRTMHRYNQMQLNIAGELI